MKNSIALFLIAALCALSFILGAKLFPKAPNYTLTTISIVDAPRAITPIRPRKPITRVDTVYIPQSGQQAGNNPNLDLIDWLSEPYVSEFDIPGEHSNIGYVRVQSIPESKMAIIDSMYMFPITQRVDSVKCPDVSSSFDYEAVLIYIGVGIISGIILDRNL